MQVNGPDATEQERRRLVGRVAELEALVYVPGLWRCAKCKFQLVQAVISASTGTVHAHDKPGEKCPNCDGPLWRVTERQAGNDMVDRYEQEVLRSRDLEAALARIAFDGDLSALAGNPMRWPCTVAYQALGGRFESGVRIDDAALRARFNMQRDR